MTRAALLALVLICASAPACSAEDSPLPARPPVPATNAPPAERDAPARPAAEASSVAPSGDRADAADTTKSHAPPVAAEPVAPAPETPFPPASPTPPAASADEPAPPAPAPAPSPPPAPPAREDEPVKPAPKAAPDPAPPPTPATAPDTAAEIATDAKAREVLGAAAARQHAGELAEPGRLQSFHVVFGKATFQRDQKDGGTTMVETDAEGLVFDWKQGSIKTAVTINAATTTKAWFEPRKIGWISDGSSTSSLLGAEHKVDYDELQFHRKIISQLLDVVILEKLLHDKSRWRTLADSAPYEKTVALQRIPPEGATDAVPITLWVATLDGGGYGDVVAASMPPLEAGGPTVFHRFSYHETFPRVRVKTGDAEPADSKLRFPFGVSVYEQHPGEETLRKVLEVFTRDVSVNTVVDTDFAQPKR